eukprot:3156756-Rhodomonas_salina.2
MPVPAMALDSIHPLDGMDADVPIPLGPKQVSLSTCYALGQYSRGAMMLAYDAMRTEVLTKGYVPPARTHVRRVRGRYGPMQREVSWPIGLRCPYGVPKSVVWSYVNPVLVQRMALRKSGTHIAYDPTRGMRPCRCLSHHRPHGPARYLPTPSYAMSGTDLAYVATSAPPLRRGPRYQTGAIRYLRAC